MDKHIEYTPIRIKNVTDLEIHELANLTPSMKTEEFNALKNDMKLNGQLEPLVMYRNKVIDGRHRTKAAKELGWNTLKVKAIESNLPIEDVRSIILRYENRRHQTPTQKAIFALREYNRLKTEGEKASQGSVAALFGTTRQALNRAKVLSETVSSTIMDTLFNGGKINIGSIEQPFNTDSLTAVYNYFKKQQDETLIGNIGSGKLTDDEIAAVNNKITECKNEFSGSVMKYIAERLHIEYSYQG